MNQRGRFKFRLYVAGRAMNAAQASNNLNAFCRTHLSGGCAIEVVDVFKQPMRALAEGIFMTPTLIKHAPGPVIRIVGTLSQPDIVLHALGLDTVVT